MLKFFKKNSFNYLYASLFLLFLFQFALETNKYCDNFTRLLSIGIVFTWYFYWVPYLVETYNYKLYFPK